MYVLLLYFENMVSEDTAVFVKEHLENCSDCAVEFEHLKSGKQIDKAEIKGDGCRAGCIYDAKMMYGCAITFCSGYASQCD